MMSHHVMLASCRVTPVVLVFLLVSRACHLFMSCPVIASRVRSCRAISCLVTASRVMSCHALFCHLFSCHVLRCHVMSCPVMLCDVMSCVDTAVVSCLGTGSLMSFLWCHVSCFTSCRLSLCYGMFCHLIPCYASSLYSCHFIFCYLFSCHIISCHVTTCRVRSSDVVSCIVSLALATRRKLRFVFDMPSYCIRVRGFATFK